MRTKHFGQTIGLGDVGSNIFHILDHHGCRRCTGGHNLQAVGKPDIIFLGKSRHADENSGRSTQMGDPHLGDNPVDLNGIHLSQADMGGPHGCDAPGKTPSVTMEHGQGP